jgi:hypothetical protein
MMFVGIVNEQRLEFVSTNRFDHRGFSWFYIIVSGSCSGAQITLSAQGRSFYNRGGSGFKQKYTDRPVDGIYNRASRHVFTGT